MPLNKSVFIHVNSAANIALPAFAAERRAVVPLLLGARRCRSICSARGELSSKPAAAAVGRTDGRPTIPCSACSLY